MDRGAFSFKAAPTNKMASRLFFFFFAVGISVSLPAQGGVPAPNGYAIITTNDIVARSDRLKHFVRMKELEGHPVVVVTENDFGGLTGQFPNGRAEKIREWLKGNYVALGLSYVLLIGDPDPDAPIYEPDDDPDSSTGDIPMKMCYPFFTEDHCRSSPTDYFYADLTGNWDLDGDGFYGEDLPFDNPRSPHPDIAPDTFSAQWIGKINIEYPYDYKFTTYSDDGVRVYIDGALVIDNWTDHALVNNESAPLALGVGMHDIVVQYYQNTEDAEIRLFWETLESGDAHVIGHFTPVKPENLYHLEPVFGLYYVPGGLDVTYYDAIVDFIGTTVIGGSGVTTVKAVNDVFETWLTGDTGPGGRQKNTQVKVGRIPVYGGNVSDLDSILGKIIQYETDPGDISWRKSILLPMDDMGNGFLNYALAEAIINDYANGEGFKSYRIFEEDFTSKGGTKPENTPCDAPTVINEWKNHYGVVTWFSHGGPADSVIFTSDAPSLDNDFPSFTFQACCFNGMPERSDNLGYALLKNGAVATVAASRATYFGNATALADKKNGISENEAYWYTRNLIFNDGNPMSAGEALYAVKREMGDISANAMEYNLYGDPDSYLMKVYPNMPPVAATRGPYTGEEGASITLGAIDSYDPEGDSLEYRWDFESDGVWDTAWSTSPYASYTSFDDGLIQARVEVRDALGLHAFATASMSFANVPPVVEAGADQTIDEGAAADIFITFNDPGNDTFTYAVDFGDGTGLLFGGLPRVMPVSLSHTYRDNGIYKVTLTMSDEDGGTGMDSMRVIVRNVAPSVDAGPDKTAVVKTDTAFNGSFADPGSDAWTYEWDFGDGTPIVTGTLTPLHSYANKGTYTVKLTVKDDDGGIGSDTLRVSVKNPSPLSFEIPWRPWTKGTGSANFTMSQDTANKTEGKSSVKLNGTGNMILNSPVFSSDDLLYYSSTLKLDVYMTSPATNPYYKGTVQIYFTSAQAKIYNKMIGQVSLDSYPLNQWNTLTFSIPTDVYKLFTGSYTDIQMTIVVNTNQVASNPYRIDNLRFSGR